MKRRVTQTATRSIALSREVIVEIPADVDPDQIDANMLESAVASADVEWEVEDVDFEIDFSEWSDADDDENSDVVYEE